MCRRHWLSVPAPMQRAVWDAFRRYQRAIRFTRDGVEGELRALRAAQAAAIAAVAPKALAP